MRQLLRLAQWFALLAALTACSSDPQVIHQRVYVKQEVPASLLTCALGLETMKILEGLM